MQGSQRHNSTFIEVEDFNALEDNKFIKEALIPYFKDLFRDLSLRATQPPVTHGT